MAILKEQLTGRIRKCAYVNSVPNEHGQWQGGWGWGRTWNPDAYAADWAPEGASVDQGQYYTVTNYPVLPGAAIHVTLTWWREMSGTDTVRRFSDLDLYVRRSSDQVTLDSSVSGLENVEKVRWTNSGGSTVAVDLRVSGFNTRGLGAQPFALCYEER